jgi:hypothetical protein
MARLTEARFYALEKRMQLEEDDRINVQVLLDRPMEQDRCLWQV